MRNLFSAAVGVPFRRYRGWLRMRCTIAAIVGGANFTRAAHEAEFADQAHFANAFRRTFGAPPARSLQGIRGPTASCGSGSGAQARQYEHPDRRGQVLPVAPGVDGADQGLNGFAARRRDLP